MSLALAITGLIAVPLATTIGIQLLIPASISREVSVKQQELKSTLVVSDDTEVAQTFTPGLKEPEYGTFNWTEFSEDGPVPTSSRYFFDKGSLFRVIKRGREETPPHLVVPGIDKYADVTFTPTAPAWALDSTTNTWSYREGFILVSIIRTRVTEGGETIKGTVRLVADFRPQLTRPVGRPAP
jgi:hypothetical protein